MFPEGRLFDFLVVGVVALIVVGPKDLPVLMRRFGQFVARIRGMAAEFRASFDELARQSELDELRREVQALRGVRPMDFALRHLGAGEAATEIRSSLSETTAALNAQNAPVNTPVLEPAKPEPAETETPPQAEPAPAAVNPGHGAPTS